MASQTNSANTGQQNPSSAQPLFTRNPNLPPELNPSAPPPSYPGPPQYPAPSGMVCLQYYPPPSPPQGMGYPQHNYYQPGEVVYPEQPQDTKFPIDQLQQQQQFQPQNQMIMTGNMPAGVTPVVIDQGRPVSMVCAFVLSGVVYFLGGGIFAAMAFALAIVGRNSATNGNNRAARQMRNVSYGLSIFGILTTLAILAIYLGVFLSPAFTSDPWSAFDFPKFNSSYYRYY